MTQCVHEMAPGTCSYCTGRDGGEAAEAARIAELRETWRGFRADYPGRCVGCGGSIAVGDPIKAARGRRGWVALCCVGDDGRPAA